jgi:hypothetical protein
LRGKTCHKIHPSGSRYENATARSFYSTAGYKFFGINWILQKIYTPQVTNLFDRGARDSEIGCKQVLIDARFSK